mmetsp:Transcript_5851/g.7485  ORF Transcript_5851/g.7485 Transcript_5851/m.7485 type:complete len:242 (+) Transcript_5851:195-920(+)
MLIPSPSLFTKAASTLFCSKMKCSSLLVLTVSSSGGLLTRLTTPKWMRLLTFPSPLSKRLKSRLKLEITLASSIWSNATTSGCSRMPMVSSGNLNASLRDLSKSRSSSPVLSTKWRCLMPTTLLLPLVTMVLAVSKTLSARRSSTRENSLVVVSAATCSSALRLIKVVLLLLVSLMVLSESLPLPRPKCNLFALSRPTTLLLLKLSTLLTSLCSLQHLMRVNFSSLKLTVTLIFQNTTLFA